VGRTPPIKTTGSRDRAVTHLARTEDNEASPTSRSKSARQGEDAGRRFERPAQTDYAASGDLS